jgi:hypothetical protein
VPDLDAQLEPFAPVSLEELDERAALLRRVDQKYVLPLDEFEDLAGQLADDHDVLDIDGRRRFAYESIYFDTPGLRCFHDHVDGRRPRFKTRTRCYSDTGYCVFEVKLKLEDGETDKRQIDYEPDEKDRVDPAAERLADETLEEVGIELDDPLRKRLETRFQRFTLSSRRGPERVTCDVEVELAGTEGGERRLRPGLILVETKSKSGESPTDRLLAARGVEPISLSKYKLGIEMLVVKAGAEADSASRFFV